MNNLNYNSQNGGVSPRFKGEVLDKIYRVWLWRKFLPVLIAEIAALALFLYWLGRLIFVEQVIDNGIKVLLLKPVGVIPFAISAFEHAALLTKAVVLVAVILVAFLIRHLTQGLLRYILVRENYFSRVGKS